jgi:hypothetical protein
LLKALFLLLALCVGFVASDGSAAAAVPLEFKADHYSRDLKTNVWEGNGHAWLKHGIKEITADKIRLNIVTKIADAEGNVHIREGEIDIWANQIHYELEGDKADMAEATLSTGKLVLTGVEVHRLDSKRFEIDEGTYSNCNLELRKDQDVGKCEFDWKIYGHHFSITLEEYAHVTDAIVYVSKLPVLYTPYFIVPVKTKRASGFLMPMFNYNGDLGNGVSIPYFWALSPWQDLLINPMYYSSTGYHLGLGYRYRYSDTAFGNLDTFMLQRRFSNNRDAPAVGDPARNYILGFIGEWALNGRNQFSLGGRAYSRQVLKYVSNPFYTYDYAQDLLLLYESPSLRSQFAVVVPKDDWLLTGQIQNHQSLVVTKDYGIDQGGVTQLPEIIFSKMTTPIGGDLFSYEFDARFTNFWRPGSAYDPVPSVINPADTGRADPNSAFHVGDYIRTGRRLNLEPRLVVNVPMPNGFQFQPELIAGTLLYNLDVPTPRVIHQDYVQASLPISMYLSRTFKTDIPGYETVNHVFQPRLILSSMPYTGGNLNDPFFFNDEGVTYPNSFFNDPTHRLSNPRFDLLDQVAPVSYARIELINRLRKKAPDGQITRFLLLQVSEQFNSAIVPGNPSFAQYIGPIEILADITFWRLSLQTQATFQVQTSTSSSGDETNESEWSNTLTYRSPIGDMLQLNTNIVNSADPTLTQQYMGFVASKTLPTFFDINGGVDFNFTLLPANPMLGYHVGLVFAQKPRSCWGMVLNAGKTTYSVPFVNFSFLLDIAPPSIAPPPGGT